MNNRIAYIYKITSPTGRVYIGQTTNPNDRWYRYMNNKCPNQPTISRSIVKYGWEAHTLEIIEKLTEWTPELLDNIEIYWIDYYKCNYRRYPEHNGLNLTDGGKGKLGGFLTEKQKERLRNRPPSILEAIRLKISKSNKGMKSWNKGRTGVYSKETLLKMSLVKLNKPPVSVETRQKMAKAKKGTIQPKELINKRLISIQNGVINGTNKVSKLLINIETGIYYESLTMAAKAHNINRTTLTNRLLGKLKNKTSLRYA